MKKKIFFGVICGVAMLGIVGCSGGSNTSNSTDKANETNKSEDNKTALLDDNSVYFIMIDGKKFVAGDKIDAISSTGFSLSDDEADEEIPAQKYMIGAGSMKNAAGDTIFDVTPYNTQDSSKTVKESVIGGLSLSNAWASHDERSADFEVYGGIKLGSTKEEVEAVFGEPSMTTGEEPNKSYRYESSETYRNYKFAFEDGKVSGIEWMNLEFNK